MNGLPNPAGRETAATNSSASSPRARRLPGTGSHPTAWTRQSSSRRWRAFAGAGAGAPGPAKRGYSRLVPPDWWRKDKPLKIPRPKSNNASAASDAIGTDELRNEELGGAEVGRGLGRRPPRGDPATVPAIRARPETSHRCARRFRKTPGCGSNAAGGPWVSITG